jgi:hypothetical protein
MKTSLIITSFTLAIAVVLVAGCTSFGGGDQTPTAVPSAASTGSGSPNTVSSSPTTAPITKLTDAQLAQARNIAEANATIKGALASGYAFSQTDIYDRTIPTASVQYMRNSNSGLDVYIVEVDLSQNKVNSVTHAQHPYPTPAPTAPLQ